MQGGDGQRDSKNERRKLLRIFKDVPTAAGRFNSGPLHHGLADGHSFFIIITPGGGRRRELRDGLRT